MDALPTMLFLAWDALPTMLFLAWLCEHIAHVGRNYVYGTARSEVEGTGDPYSNKLRLLTHRILLMDK